MTRRSELVMAFEYGFEAGRMGLNKEQATRKYLAAFGLDEPPESLAQRTLVISAEDPDFP